MHLGPLNSGPITDMKYLGTLLTQTKARQIGDEEGRKKKPGRPPKDVRWRLFPPPRYERR